MAITITKYPMKRVMSNTVSDVNQDPEYLQRVLISEIAAALTDLKVPCDIPVPEIITAQVLAASLTSSTASVAGLRCDLAASLASSADTTTYGIADLTRKLDVTGLTAPGTGCTADIIFEIRGH